MASAKSLYYDGDTEYPVEIGDDVAIVAAEMRFPAMVKKIHVKARKLTVSFEGIDPVLDLIILRKSARVPFAAVEFVGRTW